MCYVLISPFLISQTATPLVSVFFEATYGEKYELYVNAPKVLQVTLVIPPDYSSPTTVRVTNQHYADAAPKARKSLHILVYFTLTVYT